MQREPTLKMIAEKLNISTGTVSRAIHGKKDINPETRERVLAKIRELNYIPNKYARSLSVKNHLRIGVILLYNAHFWLKVKKGLEMAEQEMSRFGIDIEYICLDRLDVENVLKHIDYFHKKKFRGIILTPIGIEDINYELNMRIDKGVPVVLLNDDIPGSRRLFYIGPDNRHIGRLAGELIGKMTHTEGKSIAVSNKDPGSGKLPLESRERYEGFSEVLEKDYCSINFELCTYNVYSNSQDVLTNKLKKDNTIKAIYSSDGYTADVAAAVKKSGRSNIVVVGHEISDSVQDLLNDGMVSAVICQNPKLQGYYSLKGLVDHLIEKRLPNLDRVHIKFNLYTKYNCYEADGYIGEIGLSSKSLV